MSAAISPCEQHQRARGSIEIEAIADGALTRPWRLARSGCLHLRLPRPEQPGWMPLVLVNSSGGIAAGDELTISATARRGARLSIAAQAAERFYRRGAVAMVAKLRNHLHVEAGAALEWLPQESILFDDAALDRRLEIALDPGAWFLGVEMLVFGRAAMGEILHRLDLRDAIRLRRGGRLLLNDAVRIDGDAAALLAGKASADGGRAVASLIHAAPHAAQALAPLRAALDAADAQFATQSGVSTWNDVLLARIVAPTGAALRASVAAALNIVRHGRALPRVWSC